MDEIWHRYIESLFARLDGPLHFRFIVQPTMAAIFAVIDGVKDGRHHRLKTREIIRLPTVNVRMISAALANS